MYLGSWRRLRERGTDAGSTKCVILCGVAVLDVEVTMTIEGFVDDSELGCLSCSIYGVHALNNSFFSTSETIRYGL